MGTGGQALPDLFDRFKVRFIQIAPVNNCREKFLFLFIENEETAAVSLDNLFCINLNIKTRD